VDTARVMELYAPAVAGAGGQVGSGYRVGPEVVLTGRSACCRNFQDQPVDIPDDFLVRLFPVKLLFRRGMSDPARFA
jgi:hypothetical protein